MEISHKILNKVIIYLIPSIQEKQNYLFIYLSLECSHEINQINKFFFACYVIRKSYLKVSAV